METFAPDTLNQTPSIPLDTLGQVEGAEITAPVNSTTPPVVSDNASSGDGNSLADNGMLPQQSPLDFLSFDGNLSSGGSGTLPSDGGSSLGSGSPMGGGNPFAGVGGNPFAAGANPVSANGNEIMGNGNWQLIDGQLQSTDANAAGGNLPFGGGNPLFSDGIPLPFGLGEIAVGDGDGSSATNNTTIGNGNWHLGSNNTTLGNGNWQISDDNATIGNGNWNLGSGNATIGNGNWYLANDNAPSGSDDLITGSPLAQGDSASLDNKIIIGNDDWVIVTDRDAITGGSDISNDQLIANINALIYQVGLDFVGLLGGSMTFDQPMSTQGTDTNESNALNSIGNSDEFLPSLTGIQANPTGIQAEMSSDLGIRGN
jgi:hypothetical protein